MVVIYYLVGAILALIQNPVLGYIHEFGHVLGAFLTGGSGEILGPYLSSMRGGSAWFTTVMGPVTEVGVVLIAAIKARGNLSVWLHGMAAGAYINTFMLTDIDYMSSGLIVAYMVIGLMALGYGGIISLAGGRNHGR